MNIVGNACAFCEKFVFDRRRERVDTVLAENSHFIIVPALGSLVPGYLLIVTKEHYRCLAAMDCQRLVEMDGIVRKLRTALTSLYGAAVFFEHGPACTNNGTGSCIDHAHLHCVPYKKELRSQIDLEDVVYNITLLKDLRRYSDRPYLFLEDGQANRSVYLDRNIPSQYLRMVIAEGLGFSGLQYDWTMYPFYNKIDATIEAFDSINIEI